jgi:hypothetical protein
MRYQRNKLAEKDEIHLEFPRRNGYKEYVRLRRGMGRQISGEVASS